MCGQSPEEAGTVLRNVPEVFVALYFRKGVCRAGDAGKIVFLGTVPGLAALSSAECQLCYPEVYMKHWSVSLKRLEVFSALAYCDLFHIRSFVVRKLYTFKKNIELY